MILYDKQALGRRMKPRKTNA